MFFVLFPRRRISGFLPKYFPAEEVLFGVYLIDSVVPFLSAEEEKRWDGKLTQLTVCSGGGCKCHNLCLKAKLRLHVCWNKTLQLNYLSTTNTWQCQYNDFSAFWVLDMYSFMSTFTNILFSGKYLEPLLVFLSPSSAFILFWIDIQSVSIIPSNITFLKRGA